MGGSDLLLSVPIESIAVRAIVTSLAALVLARLVLRAGLRVPKVRVAAVLLPTSALLATVALSWGRTDLPSLWATGASSAGVFIETPETMRALAPMALPLLLGAWAAIAGIRIAWHLSKVHRAKRAAVRRVNADNRPTARLVRTVHLVATRMKVPVPPVAVMSSCKGGACIAGVRRPVLVVDGGLLATLDDEELEGLVAHELAHVKRRDNLVALLVTVARDLAFFVPGGTFALRRLHREREAAADLVAVRATDRPGALASGLLKVLDHHHAPALAPGCAAFAPSGTLVSRVENLVGARPIPGPGRSLFESVIVTAAAGTAVAAGILVPASISGSDQAREVLAVVWTRPVDASLLVETPEAVAFATYRENRLETSRPVTTTTLQFDDSHQLDQAVLRGYSAPPSRGLGIQPRFIESLESPASAGPRWTATAVVPAGDGVGLYWLRRLTN